MGIEVNGIELPFDAADWKDLEREENARKKYKYSIKDINGLSGSAAVKKGCELIIEYFDTAFGKGSAKKVLGSETNFTKCADAMTQAVVGVSKMQTDYVNALKELESNVSAAKTAAENSNS